MDFLVTKRIDFCYGHRLMNYDGVCRHLHGHNARVEIDVRAGDGTLDARGMVVDFSDLKHAVKSWIDRELDHRMILRRDDPMAALLQAQGEPVVLIDGNPTAERLAQLIFEQTRALGFDVVAVRFWETPTSAAVYSRRT